MKRGLKYAGVCLLALILIGVVMGRFIGREPVYKERTVTDWIKVFGVPPTPAMRPGPLVPNFGRLFVSNSASIRITNPPLPRAVTAPIILATNVHADGSITYSRIMPGNPMDPSTWTTNAMPHFVMGPGRDTIVRQTNADGRVSVRIFRGTRPTNMFTGTNSPADQRILQLVNQQLALSTFPYPAYTPPYNPASDPAFLAIDHIGAPAVPYLVSALQRHDRSIDKLYNLIWTKCPPSIQTNYLKTPYPSLQLRRNASKILTLMRGAAAPAVPALIEALKDTDFTVRENAAEALGRQGIAAKSAVPALADLLSDSIPTVNRAAFAALDRIGLDTEDLQRAVEKWQRSQANPYEVKAFLRSQKLRGVTSVKVLGRLLPLWSGELRHDLLYYLEESGGTAVVLLPQLIELLANEDKETRYLTIRVLRAIGPAARAALPQLELLKKDTSLLISTSATRTIAVINGEENVSP